MSSFFTNAWRRGLLVLVLPLAMAGAVRADEVTDWHEHMLAALGRPVPLLAVAMRRSFRQRCSMR